MASDLSKLIQNSFTLTLNGLLAKDAKILKITKAHPYDIEDTQMLLVQSQFNFSTFTSKFSYLVPATSASLIFNTMMGSPITELAEEIDEDAEDAIGEFISNTSGSLTTSINGTDFDDIGQTKFNISHKEIVNGNDILDLETTYRFLIDLEDQELVVYIKFDEAILPYIETIVASEITFHQKRAKTTPEEEIIKEIEKKQEDAQKDNKKNVKEDKKIDANTKDKKLKLLIIILGASIGFILLVFFILYFIGSFDPEPIEVKKEDLNSTKVIDEVSVIKYKNVKKIDFKVSEINKERLNNKLQDLTKFSVLTQEELDKQKEEERIRLLDIEKEKRLEEFAKQNHEEPLVKKEEEQKISTVQTNLVKPKTTKEIETVNNQTLPNNDLQKEEQTPLTNPPLNYVLTTSLKYRLFKSVVQETATTKARISICNNLNGKTTIYIGPFENKELQNKMIELTQKESKNIDMTAIDITEEEFNSRCNIE